jgi:hypothetical protein
MRASRLSLGRRLRSAAPLLLVAGLVAAASRGEAALLYQITPVNLVSSGEAFTGTITTDGTIGLLTPANLLDWNVEVSGPLSFTVTPANSQLNDTVFSMVSASADEIRAAFPNGTFQFILVGTLTPDIPECSNCDEGAVQLFRSDLGRNHQGFFIDDLDDGVPHVDDFQTPVVTGGADSYLAATIVPEPARTLMLGVGLLALGCAARRSV